MSPLFLGTEGVQALLELVDQIKEKSFDVEWAKEISQVLKETKIFLKTDYKALIREDSDIADYSRIYALSDPSDAAFCAPNQAQSRRRRCAQCLAMMEAFKSIDNKIQRINWPKREEKAEAEWTLEKSREAILEWQKHVIRTIHQSIAKEEILMNLDGESVHLTLDWAMKLLPKKGRESQLDWYGKRGIPWHITVAYTRSAATKVYFQRTYVHPFGQSMKQDGDAVVAILLDTLKRIKAEVPGISKAFIRSDNAGCYHGAITLASMAVISLRSGISVQRWDFSETQSGKTVQAIPG